MEWDNEKDESRAEIGISKKTKMTVGLLDTIVMEKATNGLCVVAMTTKNQFKPLFIFIFKMNNGKFKRQKMQFLAKFLKNL